MKLPTAKTTTVTGAWLVKRAKELARRLLKTGMFSQKEVIDGYIVKATRTGKIGSGIVIDSPASVLISLDDIRTWRAVGTRDNYNSNLNMPDGPYDSEDMTRQTIVFWIRYYGFDPDAPDTPTEPNAYRRSSPLPNMGYMASKKDIMRLSFLSRYPIESNQIPIPTGATIFSGVHTHGANSRGTPGFVWTDAYMRTLTGGYGVVRVANMFPLDFQYQGDAPISSAKNRIHLFSIPVVQASTTERSEAVTDWGRNAVQLMLYEAIGTGLLPANLLWSRLWSPDEHSIDFFHNGPWYSQPNLPNYDSFVVLTDEMQAWKDWWAAWRGDYPITFPPLPAGGSRPNWTDCMTSVWFNGRFIVLLRVVALAGAYTPRPELVLGDYLVAPGVACMRFDIQPDGTTIDTEVAYEVWDSAEQYGSSTTNTPFSQWVAGNLDEEVIKCRTPTAVMATDNWLVEVYWCMEADRTEPSSDGFPMSPLNYVYRAFTDTARLEFRVTKIDDEGNELPTEIYDVFFSDLGCGIEGLQGVRSPYDTTHDYLAMPTIEKTRACDPQFKIVSSHEIGFLARTGWRFQDQTTFEQSILQYVVFDVDTGLATVRGSTGIGARWTRSHMICPHLDCVQQTIYNADGGIVQEGVLLAASQFFPTVRISRDSGATWADYITTVSNSWNRATYAYHIGNVFGGGAVPGHAVR